MPTSGFYSDGGSAGFAPGSTGSVVFQTSSASSVQGDDKLWFDSTNKRLNVNRATSKTASNLYSLEIGNDDAPESLRINGSTAATVRLKTTSGAAYFSLSDATGAMTFGAGSGLFEFVGRIRAWQGSGAAVPDYAFSPYTTSGLYYNTSNGDPGLSSSAVAMLEGAASTTNDDVSLKVNRRSAGAWTGLQRVTVGAADSGGAGYRLLRVPN